MVVLVSIPWVKVKVYTSILYISLINVQKV